VRSLRACVCACIHTHTLSLSLSLSLSLTHTHTHTHKGDLGLKELSRRCAEFKGVFLNSNVPGLLGESCHIVMSHMSVSHVTHVIDRMRVCVCAHPWSLRVFISCRMFPVYLVSNVSESCHTCK